MILQLWCLFLIVSLVKTSSITTPSSDIKIRHGAPGPQAPNVQENMPERPSPGDIEYRLTRLEVLLVEKLESIKADVRETTRKLQSLEWQSAEAQYSLKSLRTDFSSITQQVSDISDRFHNPQERQQNSIVETRVDNLAKGIQILIVATRGLTSDINQMKRNISLLINESRSVLNLVPNLVTKQFFKNSLLEMKHHQIPQPWLNSQIGCSKPQTSFSSSIPKNCRDLQDLGYKRSGIYRIQPEHSSKPFIAVCDLETNGGGWTVIQKRYDGSQDFYLNWHEYKIGFGNLGGEFWLGLEHIHQLTGNEVNELLIELEDLDLQTKTAYYSAFSVGSEAEGFPLKLLSGYNGTAGNSLMYHAGSNFSTKDIDQDGWPEGSCAQAHGGAWWYRNCDMSNLNGRYLSGAIPQQYIYQGMYWGEFRGAQYSLLRARMLVRPAEQVNPLVLDEIFNSSLSSPKSERGVRDIFKYTPR